MDKEILLITGGTGSFGNAMLDYMLEHGSYDEIRIFSRDEKKQHEMRLKYPNKRVTFYIGDVRNPESLYRPMIGVTDVFHAAAMKQVPICEDSPWEAIQTNVMGTRNVLETAINCGVPSVVVLSTDKAVEPVNTMGMTKALVEKIALDYAKYVEGAGLDTKICITRYGNVIGSRGSVLPIFYDRLSRRQPLIITDPKMTRFMMGLSEAIALVYYAMVSGDPGSIYVKKAPAATVEDMAGAVQDILRATGSGIMITGPRPGEKIHETLISLEEMYRARDRGEYIQIYPVGSYFVDDVVPLRAYTSENTDRLDRAGTIELLREHEEWRQDGRNT